MTPAISSLKFPGIFVVHPVVDAAGEEDDKKPLLFTDELEDEEFGTELFVEVEAKLSAAECCELAMVANVTGFLKPVVTDVPVCAISEVPVVEKTFDELPER